MSTEVAAPPPDAPPVDERTAWIALYVVLGATIMVALDTTIVNVALDRIGEELGGSHNVEWVVSAYLLAVCVTQPASGWLANTFGARRVLLVALAGFTAASLACALAPNLGVLIAARVLQGLSGGALMPVGMALVFSLFPRERHGRAISVWGMAAMAAPTVGPTLGGWLVTSVSWHWLFLINVPIGTLTLVAALRVLPDSSRRFRERFDGLGLLLGSGGLALFVLGLSEANQWGWGSTTTLACLAAGVAGLATFGVRALRISHPLIELRMFSDRTFRFAILALLFVYIAHFGRLVFVPLQLEGLRHVSALRVGLLFLPAGIVGAVSMGLGGRLVDRIGPRRPIMIGCAVMGAAAIGFATLDLDTPLWLIAVYLATNSFGMGLLTAPVMVAGISSLPAHLMSQGTALRSLLGQVAGALAVALLGAVISLRAGDAPSDGTMQAAYNTAFALAAVGVGISLLLASRLPRRVDAPASVAPVVD